MSYTIYVNATGQILKRVQTQDNDYEKLPEGLDVLDEYVPIGYYIEGRQPVAIPPSPSQSLAYYFDYTTKTWLLDPVKGIDLMTELRNTLLRVNVDKVNPVWYNSLTTEQQQELQTYRQGLLDVPDQSGFPTDISWPTKPTWL